MAGSIWSGLATLTASLGDRVKLVSSRFVPPRSRGRIAPLVTQTEKVVRPSLPSVTCFFGMRRPRRHVLGSEVAGEVAGVRAAVKEFGVGDGFSDRQGSGLGLGQSIFASA